MTEYTPPMLTLAEERALSRKRVDARRAEELKRVRVAESYVEFTFICGKADPNSRYWEEGR